MEPQDEDLALSLRQLAERLTECGSSQGRILREIRVHRFGTRHPDHSPPPSSHLVVALPRDDAQEPGLKWAADAQAAQLAPGPYACFLDRILSKAWVMQERARISVSRGDGRPEDGLESVDIAPPRLGDELLLRRDLHNLTLNTGGRAESVSPWSSKVPRLCQARSKAWRDCAAEHILKVPVRQRPAEGGREGGEGR